MNTDKLNHVLSKIQTGVFINEWSTVRLIYPEFPRRCFQCSCMCYEEAVSVMCCKNFYHYECFEEFCQNEMEKKRQPVDFIQCFHKCTKLYL